MSKTLKPYAAIKVTSAGQFTIHGELTFDTVQQLNIRGCQLIDASPLPIFDCKQVSNSDNSGLALILSWIKYAKSVHKSIQFFNIPPQLLAIAKVSGLQDIALKTNKA